MNEGQVNPEREKKIEQLVDETRFAKIVSTGNGRSLLIGGYVVDVYGQDPGLWVEVFSRALRRSGDNSSSGYIEARGYSYQPGGQLKG